jgi:hypothetical protein
MAIQVYVDGTDSDNPIVIAQIAKAHQALEQDQRLQIVFIPRGTNLEDIPATMTPTGGGNCQVSYDTLDGTRTSQNMPIKDFFPQFIRPHLLRTDADKQREIPLDAEKAADAGLVVIIKTLQALGIPSSDVDIIVSDVFSDPISKTMHVLDSQYLDGSQEVRTPEAYHAEKNRLAALPGGERRAAQEVLLESHADFIRGSGYVITRGEGWQTGLAASLNADEQSEVVIAGPFTAIRDVLELVEPDAMQKINAYAMAFSLDKSKNLTGDNFNCVSAPDAVQSVMAQLPLTFCPTDLFKTHGPWAQIKFDEVDATMAELGLPQMLSDLLKLYIRAGDPTKKLSEPVFDLALALLLQSVRACGPQAVTRDVTITAVSDEHVYGGTRFDVTDHTPSLAGADAEQSDSSITHRVVVGFEGLELAQENSWSQLLGPMNQAIVDATEATHGGASAETSSSGMFKQKLKDGQPAVENEVDNNKPKI